MSRTAHKLMASSGGDTGYEIDQSLLFTRVDSTKLTWNPGGGATSYRKWTFSAWVKRASLGTTQVIFGSYSGSGNSDQDYNILYFGSADQLHFGAYTYDFLATNRKFRDVGGWYHIMLVVDTFQDAADDRKKIYVNGVQETSFAVNNTISEDYNLGVLRGNPHYLGWTNSTHYYDGYMAEVYLIDSLPLTPSSFGETDSDTGQWIPKEYTGTFPGESVYSKFASGAVLTDSSGNSNTWTATNLGDADVMLDTPTNNYPTINALEPYNSTMTTLLEGNLHVIATTYDSHYYGNHTATFLVPESGKWYIETRMAVHTGTGNTSWIGVIDQRTATIPKRYGHGATAGEYFSDSAFTGMTADLIATVDTIRLFRGGSAQATVSSATETSYIIALALDVDNNKVYGGYDSGSGITWLGSGNPAAGSNGQAHTFTNDTVIQLEVGPKSDGSSNSMQTLNFGQNGTFSGYETAGGNTDGNGEGNFFYAPPSGFLALCSKNLPTPAVEKPTEHFNTVLYQGSGAVDKDVTVGFDPDMTWIKARSQAYDHVLTTATVGVGYIVKPNDNSVQADWTDYVGPYITDGIRLNDVQTGTTVNHASQTFVMWNWKAGGGGNSPGSNTDGSINTNGTSVNTTAGISITSYSGTGSTGTIGHGLGKTPSVIIVKNRSVNDNWRVQTIGDATDYMAWNWTGASTDDASSWNDTAATSTVFTVGSDTNTNRSGSSFLAICFADVSGFSKSGWFRGNASANGTFVNLGFSPAYIMLKMRSVAVSGGGDWIIRDVKRDVGNPSNSAIYTNLDIAESTTSLLVDIVSNGFKIRSNHDDHNKADETVWWMAFAEFPFKYANAR